MSDMERFPLTWPDHIPRTPPQNRVWGGFQVTPEKATQDLLKEVRLARGTDLILSTNIPVRRDGMPYATAKEPADPGVAAYFKRKGQLICIPCDAFDRVWKNIRAIGLSIADMRGPEARGCAVLTDQAFTGFLALPAPAARRWYDILGLGASATVEEISAARRRLARDNAHLPVTMAEINAAHDEGMAIRRAEG